MRCRTDRSLLLFLVGFFLLSLLVVGCAEDKGASNTGEANPESTNPTASQRTLQEQVDEAREGDTVYLTRAYYEESIVLPPGVSLDGGQMEDVVIRPPAGMPGIVAKGAGASTLSCLRVESATGAGILVEGRDITLYDVQVSDTSAGTELAGHGIYVSDSPRLNASAISSTGNAGCGMHVEDTDDVVIIHPNFQETYLENQNESSTFIIHPNFVLSEGNDAVAIIHPNFMSDNKFSNNGADGLSIIHPNFMENSYDNTSLEIKGVTVSQNQHRGVSIQGIKDASIIGLVSQKNGLGETEHTSGVFLNQSKVSLSSSYLAENVGPGIAGTEASLEFLDIADPDANISEENDGLLIIHPNFIPSTSIENNGGGGISLIDPLPFAEGKADAPLAPVGQQDLTLSGLRVSGNDHFGIQVQCMNTVIDRTVVDNTSWNINGKGAGILVDAQDCPAEKSNTLKTSSRTLFANNDGPGVYARGGSQVYFEGTSTQNKRGGIVGLGEGTVVEISQKDCTSQTPKDELEAGCLSTRINQNYVAGVALGPMVTGKITGPENLDNPLQISHTKPLAWGQGANGGDSPINGFGDGILAMDVASLTVTNVELKGNSRAGVVMKEITDPIFTNTLFSDSPYGVVLVENIPDYETPGGSWEQIPDPDFAAQLTAEMCDNIALTDFEYQGCLPLSPVSCLANDNAACELFTPCGACSVACSNDSICDWTSCTNKEEEEEICPADAQCCTDQDCDVYLTGTPGCMVITCTSQNTCEIAYDDTGVVAGDTPIPCPALKDEYALCITDDECVANTSCSTGTCVGNICDEIINEGFCQMKEGAESTCYENGTLKPDNSCKVCDADGKNDGWSPLATGSLCDDGNECTADDECKKDGEVFCEGLLVGCADDNPCTNDSCIEETCQYLPLTDETPCEDNDLCTSSSACLAGECSGVVAILCDDVNPCTTDFCNPEMGCQYEEIPECVLCRDTGECLAQAIMDDSYACTKHQCKEGVCQWNQNVSAKCDDDEYACTAEVCDPFADHNEDGVPDADDTGCYTKLKDNLCDDESFCTVDTCDPESGDSDSAGCVYEKVQECDDDNVCTLDSCSANLETCINTPDPGLPWSSSSVIDTCDSTCGPMEAIELLSDGVAPGSSGPGSGNDCVNDWCDFCEDAYEDYADSPVYCTVEDDATVCPEAYLDYIGCLNHFAGCFGVEGETIGGDIGGNIGVPLYPPPGENGGATPATVCESNLDCEIEESESTCTISLCDLTENTCVIYPDHSQCAKGLCDPWEGCTSCTEDGDGDLFLNGVCGGSDCDDTSAAKNKLQAENSDADCADGEDNDCDGLVDENDSSCASLAQLQSCLSTADCFTGYCGPEGECLPCVTDANCDDGNPCTTDSCTDNGLFGGTCTYNSTSGITCTNSEDPCGTYMCEQGSPPTCELQDCLSGASGTNGVCMEDYTTQLYCEELGCTYSTAYYDYLTSLGTGDPTSDCTTQWCNKYQELEAACGGSCSAEQQAFMQPMGWCDALPDAPEEGACSTNEDCEGLDACKVVECIAGTCSPTDFVADGTSCTGSVSCSTYTCQSGDCTGVNDPDDYNYCEPMSCTINQAYAEGLEASFTLDYSECVISWCDAQEQAYACFEPTVSLTVSQHEQCEEDFQNYSPYGADPGYLAEESFWTEEYGAWGWCPNQ